MNSEYCNQNTYDAIQIHGGSGFMMEYPIQRYYRDARITSIYEGTTQLQVVAAIRYVTNGSYLAQMREFEQAEVSEELKGIQARAKAMADKFEEAVAHVKEAADQPFHDLCARHLVEMAADVIMLHLLLHNATANADMFGKSVRVYANFAEAEIAKHHSLCNEPQPCRHQRLRAGISHDTKAGGVPINTGLNTNTYHVCTAARATMQTCFILRSTR